MSDCSNITKLLDFAYEHYRPKHTLLIISDHGEGTASSTGSTLASRSVCLDDTSIQSNKANGKPIAIGNDELAKAIRNSKMGKVDILHLDVCLESSIENVYELKDCVGYLVASPNVSTGVPWDTIVGEYISDSITPASLASQIVIEVSYDRKSFASSDDSGITNNLRALSNNAKLAPTYSAMNLAYARELFSAFSKVVDILNASIETSSFYEDRDADTGMINASLKDYMTSNASYVPMPVDYLVSSDFSFLLSRSNHGWIGNAPTGYDYDDNNQYEILYQDNGIFTCGMTTLSYEGSYSQLLDVGYLMDMFLCNTHYTNMNEDLDEIPIGEDGEYSVGEFMESCQKVVKYLQKTIMISHRNDCTRSRYITSNNLNTSSDIDNFNFYLHDLLSNSIISEVYGNLEDCRLLNHYGLVVSASCAPDVEYGNVNPEKYPFYDKLGGRPKAPSEDYAVYRNSCAFVRESGWIELLDKIFMPSNIDWNQYDDISEQYGAP